MSPSFMVCWSNLSLKRFFQLQTARNSSLIILFMITFNHCQQKMDKIKTLTMVSKVTHCKSPNTKVTRYKYRCIWVSHPKHSVIKIMSICLRCLVMWSSHVIMVMWSFVFVRSLYLKVVYIKPKTRCNMNVCMTKSVCVFSRLCLLEMNVVLQIDYSRIVLIMIGNENEAL